MAWAFGLRLNRQTRRDNKRRKTTPPTTPPTIAPVDTFVEREDDAPVLDGIEVLVDVVVPDAILMREVGIVADERLTCSIFCF
jgi:hypothetical protein